MTSRSWSGVLRCPIDARSGIDRVWGHSASCAETLIARCTSNASGGEAEDCDEGDGLWWAVTQRSDARIVAAVSSTAFTGLYWTRDVRPDGSSEVVIGPRLGEVVQARHRATTLDEGYMAAFVAGVAPADATPYREVRHIPPGTIAVWSDPSREPRVDEWSGPSTWPPPTVEGPGTRDEYLRRFDRAVDALVIPDQPLCAAMSGGLDSTFLVASLVRHADPDRPVMAYAHVPHPDAGLTARANWDPDDSHVAEAMLRRYPGLIRLERIANLELRQPLDLAASWIDATWAPPIAAPNLVWIDAMEARADDLGASSLFTGDNGNMAFSATHSYAAAHYLRLGALGDLAGLVRDGMEAGESLPTALRRRVVGPLVGPYRGVWSRRSSRKHLAGMGLPGGRATTYRRLDRTRYLDMLHDNSSVRMSLQPVPGRAVWTDPFRAHGVRSFAASMTPREWRRGPADRGYARLLGEGRVPDDIRLRTRRGGQSWDHWFVIRNQRDRYLDEVRSLRTTPVLAEVVDVDAMERTVLALPWGDRDGGSDIMLIERILVLGAFVRSSNRRLADLHRS